MLKRERNNCRNQLRKLQASLLRLNIAGAREHQSLLSHVTRVMDILSGDTRPLADCVINSNCDYLQNNNL